MEINDFSTFIQLIATLSIVFITVEYVKSYTKVLCEKFFKFPNLVEETFKKCRDVLTDRNTLNHIKSININGVNTNVQIEEVKRENELLNKQITDKENEFKTKMLTACQVRSMSSLCFFSFIVNVVLLLIGSIEKIDVNITHLFLSIFCILSTIYLFIGWLVGENECPKKYCDFSSFNHVFYGSIIIIAISILFTIGGILKKDYIFILDIPIWWYVLLICTSLCLMNFVIFFIKIKHKAGVFMQEVKKGQEELMKKCEEAKKAEEELIKVHEFSSKLKTD